MTRTQGVKLSDLQRSGMRDEKGTLKSPGECPFFFSKENTQEFGMSDFSVFVATLTKQKTPSER